MKSIYLVQPNSEYGHSIYFPYAAGSLAAFAFADDRIAEAYELKRFFYKKSAPDELVNSLEQPFLVGFSCYVWNFEYNRCLAQKIKERFPECITVFGGHQINERCPIVSADYVDYLIIGEGEESFRELLLHLIGKQKLEAVPNLIYKQDRLPKKTDVQLTKIPERVSPYLAGLFDDMVEKESLDFSAVLETNRGCPNRCAFCDWGNIKSKIRLYDMSMIKAEIDWIAAHRIEYCYCADSNFGLFPRDLEIVDYIIAKNKETGFPQKFQATYSKNNYETVFAINKKLNDAGMSKGATLSFQSMNQNVLDNIYRRNMPIENFHRLMNLYNSNGISAYSEIILGLPGETYESFKDGIEELIENGQHMSINFFNCELLNNALMSDPNYIEKHGIRSVMTEQQQYHVVPDKNDIKEYSRIVSATESMNEEDWIRSNILAVFVRAFHNLGLLQSVAIFLFYQKKIKYMTFYESLIRWAQDHPDTIVGELFSWLQKKYREVLSGNGSLTCILPAFGELIWPMDEGAFLKVIEHFDLFYREIRDFLSTFFDGDDFMDSLLLYQKSVVKNPYTKYIEIALDYDYHSFFTDVLHGVDQPQLVKKEHTLCIDTSDVPEDLPTYAKKTIWFGRKGSRNIATDIYCKGRDK